LRKKMETKRRIGPTRERKGASISSEVILDSFNWTKLFSFHFGATHLSEQTQKNKCPFRSIPSNLWGQERAGNDREDF
jgi:hypothetical protein